MSVYENKEECELLESLMATLPIDLRVTMMTFLVQTRYEHYSDFFANHFTLELGSTESTMWVIRPEAPYHSNDENDWKCMSFVFTKQLIQRIKNAIWAENLKGDRIWVFACEHFNGYAERKRGWPMAMRHFLTWREATNTRKYVGALQNYMFGDQYPRLKDYEFRAVKPGPDYNYGKNLRVPRCVKLTKNLQYIVANYDFEYEVHFIRGCGARLAFTRCWKDHKHYWVTPLPLNDIKYKNTADFEERPSSILNMPSCYGKKHEMRTLTTYWTGRCRKSTRRWQFEYVDIRDEDYRFWDDYKMVNQGSLQGCRYSWTDNRKPPKVLHPGIDRALPFEELIVIRP